MNRTRSSRPGICLAVLLLVVSAGVAIPAAGVGADGTGSDADSTRVLVVSDAETGETLLSVPVENGTVVALNYTHSVEKTPVHDIYVVAGDRLLMTRMEFDSYGWGLPANANVTQENGSYAFDPAWEGEELYVKPGRVAGHTLRIGDRTYDLVALSGARSVRLHLAVRPPPTDPLHAPQP